MDPGWSLEGTCLPMTVTTNVKEFHVQFNGLSSCFAASMSVSCIYILYVYVYIYIYVCVLYFRRIQFKQGWNPAMWSCSKLLVRRGSIKRKPKGETYELNIQQTETRKSTTLHVMFTLVFTAWYMFSPGSSKRSLLKAESIEQPTTINSDTTHYSYCPR